jgi:hypothetical protein
MKIKLFIFLLFFFVLLLFKVAQAKEIINDKTITVSSNSILSLDLNNIITNENYEKIIVNCDNNLDQNINQCSESILKYLNFNLEEAKLQNYQTENLNLNFMKINKTYLVFIDDNYVNDFKFTKELNTFLSNLNNSEKIKYKESKDFTFGKIANSVLEFAIYLLIINSVISILLLLKSKNRKLLTFIVFIISTIMGALILRYFTEIKNNLEFWFNNIFNFDESMLLFLTSLTFILLIQIVIITLVKRQKFKIKEIANKDFSVLIFKYYHPLIFILFVIGLFNFFLFQNLDLLSLAFALLFIFFILEKLHVKSSQIKYSRSRKFILTIVVIFTSLIFIILTQNYYYKSLISRDISLFSQQENIILPNLVKNNGESYLITNFKPNFNLFSNEFLIYSPNSSNILNTVYEGIKKEDSGFLISKSLPDIIKAYVSDEELQNKITKEGFSEFMQIRINNNLQNQKYIEMETSINCRSLESEKLTINYFKVSDDKTSSSYISLGKITNCKDKNENFSFSIPSNLLRYNYVFQINTSTFKSLKAKNNESNLYLKSIPIQKNLFFTINFINPQNSLLVKNYIIVPNTDKKAKYRAEFNSNNFIYNLNKLILINSINDNFYLWSDFKVLLKKEP